MPLDVVEVTEFKSVILKSVDIVDICEIAVWASYVKVSIVLFMLMVTLFLNVSEFESILIEFVLVEFSKLKPMLVSVIAALFVVLSSEVVSFLVPSVSVEVLEVINIVDALVVVEDNSVDFKVVNSFFSIPNK